jgi:hypothetical protein
VPSAPTSDPFEVLPFPNPGDRIRADDFKALSQSLLLIRDVFSLSGALFGQNFGQAKLLLAAQHYEIRRVMTVFGAEIEQENDTSLDNRKVMQVLPIQLGTSQVAIIVTEAVETRRFAPNLLGLTYGEASERLRSILGDVTFPSMSTNATQPVGLTLAQAQELLSQ